MKLHHIPSPCFVLEEKKLLRNLKTLQKVQKEAGIEIICALKGFAMYPVFDLVKQYLAGATASSLHEAMLCNEYFGKKAHLYSPVYNPNEFHELVKLSSHITFNTISEFERYVGDSGFRRQETGNDLKIVGKAETRKHGNTVKPQNLDTWEQEHLNTKKLQHHNTATPQHSPKLALRINPDYSEVDIDMYNPCIPGSRLGIFPENMPPKLPEGITGLHFHSLCENDSFVLERTLQSIEKHYSHLLHEAEWFNFGGGHLITGENYDVEHLINLLKNFKQKYKLKLIMEPGSAVGWQTGVLVATVLDIFESRGVNVAMLDVSFAAHMPDTLEMPYQPKILGARSVKQDNLSKNDEGFRYRMGGNTCLAGDFMGDYIFDKPLEVGEKIVFDDMMHYTMVKTTTFNGVNLPSIGIWRENDKNDGNFELIRKFGYESYKDRLG